MSMFQPQNYGADFIGGMTAMSNMVNDRRRLDMDEKRQAEEDKTRAIQRDTATLDNQRTAQALDTEKKLQAFLTHARDWDNGQITKEGLATLNRVTPELVKETPYVSDKIEDFPARRQANNVLAKGVESISTLPPGNYIYTRADNLPEINQTLDAYQMNLPPERFNKEFVDKDGTVTGKAGTVYKTTGVGGFAMMSGDGRDAAFTPMFSVADAQGNPMVKPDGKPLLVPATVNGSNDPNDPVRKIRPEEILTKIGFANKLMDTAEKLVGTPDKRKEYVAQQAPYYMGQEGLKEIYQSANKGDGVVSVDPSHDVYDKKGKLIAKGTPKEDKERAPSNLFGEGVKGSDLARQYPEAKGLKPNAYYRVTKDNGKYYFAEERPPKEPKGDGESGPAKGGKRTIKEIVDEYQALKKARDSQYAKDEENWRQANAQRAKDMLPPISFESYYGGKSSQAHAAITQDMYQLRDVASGLGYDLINMKPLEAKAQRAAAPKQQAKAQTPQPKKQQVASAKPKTAADYLKARGL